MEEMNRKRHFIIFILFFLSFFIQIIGIVIEIKVILVALNEIPMEAEKMQNVQHYFTVKMKIM